MQIHMKCLLFIFSCLIGLGASDIEKMNIAVNIDGDVLTITLDADNPEVDSALFSMEISNECSSVYIFLHTINKNGSFVYKMNEQTKTQINDTLRINAVFEKNGQGITTPYEFKIDEHGKVVKNKKTECDCLKSETEQNVRNASPCSGTLIFEENFDKQLQPRWTYELRSLVLAAEPEQEFVAYVGTNTLLKDDLLYINASRVLGIESFEQKNCTSLKNDIPRTNECGPIKRMSGGGIPPVFSAKLHTKNSFQFKYGRVEIRAKMPIGDWLFPYLILQPEHTKSEDKFVNHIRIAYARGNKKLQDKSSMPINGKVLFGSAVLWDKLSTKHKEYMNTMRNPQEELYGKRFYNYTLIWHKERIIFKVDGYKYGEITNKDVLSTFNENKCFIVLGLTAGGGLNFADDYLLPGMRKYSNGDVKAAIKFNESNTFKSWEQPSLMIDYVKVYTTHENEE